MRSVALWTVFFLPQRSSPSWTRSIISACVEFSRSSPLIIIESLTLLLLQARTNILRNWHSLQDGFLLLPDCTHKTANLLGHPYRHPESLESQATFMPSAAYHHTPHIPPLWWGGPKLGQSPAWLKPPTDWIVSSRMRPRLIPP